MVNIFYGECFILQVSQILNGLSFFVTINVATARASLNPFGMVNSGAGENNDCL